MGKFLDGFLAFKNEADATRKFALFAVIVITFGLASLSVTGIVATATWTWLSALPIIGMIFAVLGAELLATVAFIRMLTASTMSRKIAGAFIFLGLAVFAESSSSLAAKAALAGEEAATLGTAQQAAINGTGAELERVRTQLAELKTEQQIMASASPEGISQAQRLLLAQGLYFGSVDGISRDKTESAMRARGEAIQRELATLKAREDGLMQGQASPVQQATSDRRLLQIEQADAASAAFWSWLWLIIMLCVLEGARSLSLWAYITDISGKEAQRDRDWTDELAALRHQQERARIIAETNAAVAAYSAAPEPAPAIAAPPPPEPVQEPEPVEPLVAPPVEEPRSDASQRARNAAKSNVHMNKADELRSVILVNDNRARNAERDAAPLAAQ